MHREVQVSDTKIKVLLAKPGLDGHDVGVKVVARALIDAGFDVTYTGLRKSPDEIARAARDIGADVIALSVLSGSHVPLCEALKQKIEEYQLTQKAWVVGGNIPSEDIDALKDIGVDGVFRTGSKLDDIVSFVREKVHERTA